MVLLNLFDQSDSLQDICDIVDSSLLDFEGLYGIVEIKGLLIRFFEQIDEFFSQLDKAILLPSSLIAPVDIESIIALAIYLVCALREV